MEPSGYLFISVNNGPVISVPVSSETGRLMLELWYGGADAEHAAPELRNRIEGILTAASAGPE
jgi:hypothetical protein